MRRQSKREQEAEARRAADPLSQKLGREDIDYDHEDLPPAPRNSIVTTPAPPDSVIEKLLSQIPHCEDLECDFCKERGSARPEPRAFKFRTPTRCQNGHVRFLFYSINFGHCEPSLWGRQPCNCPTGEIGEGFSKCGPEQQWTGLLDSEGHQLFEGDVVWHSKYGSAYEVYWEPDSTGFFVRNAENHVCTLSKLCQQYLKIIGNVTQGV